jgi:hypothetical protein
MFMKLTTKTNLSVEFYVLGSCNIAAFHNCSSANCIALNCMLCTLCERRMDGNGAAAAECWLEMQLTLCSARVSTLSVTHIFKLTLPQALESP